MQQAILCYLRHCYASTKDLLRLCLSALLTFADANVKRAQPGVGHEGGKVKLQWQSEADYKSQSGIPVEDVPEVVDIKTIKDRQITHEFNTGWRWARCNGEVCGKEW